MGTDEEIANVGRQILRAFTYGEAASYGAAAGVVRSVIRDANLETLGFGPPSSNPMIASDAHRLALDSLVYATLISAAEEILRQHGEDSIDRTLEQLKRATASARRQAEKAVKAASEPPPCGHSLAERLSGVRGQ